MGFVTCTDTIDKSLRWGMLSTFLQDSRSTDALKLNLGTAFGNSKELICRIIICINTGKKVKIISDRYSCHMRSAKRTVLAPNRRDQRAQANPIGPTPITKTLLPAILPAPLTEFAISNGASTVYDSLTEF